MINVSFKIRLLLSDIKFYLSLMYYHKINSQARKYSNISQLCNAIL